MSWGHSEFGRKSECPEDIQILDENMNVRRTFIFRERKKLNVRQAPWDFQIVGENLNVRRTFRFHRKI
jgi:hypothetical protein